MSDNLSRSKAKPRLTFWDKRLIAWHEAGHVVVSHYLPEQEEICRVSIVPSDEAYGMMKTAKRRYHNMTRMSLLGNISVALAGRLSEEIFLNEITSSCIHDLSTARDIAIKMVSSYGMGRRSGLLSCCNHIDHSFLLLSEQQRENLFLDVDDLIKEARDNAIMILKSHKRQVDAVAAELTEKGTLLFHDIKALF